MTFSRLWHISGDHVPVRRRGAQRRWVSLREPDVVAWDSR